MKRLKDEISLSGVERITMTELRKCPGEIFTRVNLGKNFVITKSGKDVAIISKPPGRKLLMSFDSAGKLEYTD